MKRRIFAFVLVLCAAAVLLPVGAWADGDDWLEDLISHYEYNESHHWKLTNITRIPFAYEEHEFRDEDSYVSAYPSCTAEGEIVYRCECGYEKREKLEKTEHSFFQAHDELRHWTECSVCGLQSDGTLHAWDGGTVTVTPSCCTEGERVYTCSCGAQRSETLPMGDHAWEPRHDESRHWEECIGCGQKKSIAAHSWGSGTVSTPPTCLADGVMSYTCSCGAGKTEKIDKITHQYTEKFDVYYHWQECQSCGGKESIAAHSWDEGRITTEPSCRTEGVKTFSCTACSATKTVSIPVSSEHRWDTGSVTAPATCLADGVRTFTCLDCGTTKTEAIEKSGEHRWDEGRVTTPASCEKDGVRTYTCLDCKAEKTEPIDRATAHDFNSGEITVEPGCESEGKRVITCIICGEKKTERVQPIGHRWTVGAVTKEPTVDSPGETSCTCENCGAVKTAAIPALGGSAEEKTETLAPAQSVETENAPIRGVIGTEPVTEERKAEPKENNTLGILLITVGAAGVAAAAAGIVIIRKKG